MTYLRQTKLWGNDAPLFPATEMVVGANRRFEAAGLKRQQWSSAAPIRAIFRRACAESIYVTFQDDWVAFKTANLMNWRRLMWANDFPHSDSTWPWSQELLAEHAGALSEEQRRAILGGNVAELYRIDVARLAAV